MAKLGQYVNIKTGKLDANASSENGKYPFFTCAVEPLKIDTYSYDCECVLVAGNGDLNVKYYEGKFDAYQRTYIIESKDKETLYVPYMYYFLDEYVETLRNLSIGGVIKYIKLGNLTDADIPITDLSTQKQIVSNLDKVTHTIDLCNAILEKLDLLVKSRFVEMFGDFDNLINKWHLYRFSDVTINLDNTRKPIKDADRQKIQGIYPYYGATGIVDYLNDYRIEGEYLLISEDGKALEFRNKDIAFIAKGKIWVNNHAHVLQCKENMNMVFLMFYMNNRDISSWVTGIDQKKLNRDNLDKMPVGVPPLALQQQFAAFVEQTDKSKLAIKQVLAKAETLKKALMQEYFG